MRPIDATISSVSRFRAILCAKTHRSKFIELEGITDNAAIAVITLLVIRNNYQLANFKPSYSESDLRSLCATLRRK